MKLKIDIKKQKTILIGVLLFFAAMNFMAKFFYFSFAALLVLFFMQGRFAINQTSFLYLALGLWMAVYNCGEGILSMIRCFAFVSLYWVGYNFTLLRSSTGNAPLEYDFDYMQRCSFVIFGTISFGSFTHYLMNYIYNYGANIGRNTNDIWTGTMMAATGQAAIACLMLGFSVAMILIPAKKKYRVIGIACVLLIFAYDLVLACRTIPVMFFIILVAGLLFAQRTFRRSSDRFKFVAGFAFVVLMLAIAFFADIGGIQEKVFGSNLFNRFNSSSVAASRFDIKLSYLAEWWRYPFGGLHMRAKYGYAHDLLLDGYDEYGVAGFLLLAAVVVSGIREFYRFIRYAQGLPALKMVVLCVYLSIILEFCIEPILTGMPWLFSCFCLINGCVKSLNIAAARQLKRSTE